MRRKLNENDINEIITLLNNGYTVSEIAKMYNVIPQTIYYHLNKKGIEKIKANSKRHEKALKRMWRARHLYMQGKKIHEIAKELGVKESTVKRYLNGFISDKQGRRSTIDRSAINKILNKILEGYDYERLAKEFNISVITVRKSIRNAVRSGMIPEDKLWLVAGRSPTHPIRKKLIELLESGIPPTEVAKMTGVPLVYVNSLVSNKFKKD